MERLLSIESAFILPPFPSLSLSAPLSLAPASSNLCSLPEVKLDLAVHFLVLSWTIFKIDVLLHPFHPSDFSWLLAISYLITFSFPG